jgi:hypothetical protein
MAVSQEATMLRARLSKFQSAAPGPAKSFLERSQARHVHRLGGNCGLDGFYFLGHTLLHLFGFRKNFCNTDLKYLYFLVRMMSVSLALKRIVLPQNRRQSIFTVSLTRTVFMSTLTNSFCAALIMRSRR